MKPATPFDGIAWVTGASSGIGRMTALRLAERGFRVAITARAEDALHKLAAEAQSEYGNIVVMPGDVTDEARMADIVAELERDHGGVGLAVLNAGIYLPIEGDVLDVATFRKSFDVNLGGVVNCLVPLSHAMAVRGHGQIAIVSSVAGYGGLPTSAAYGATKAGLTNMAESLKFDFDKMGILLQVVHPGFVDTPATRSNPFSMPMLMDVDKAADALVEGLRGGQFEITFPKAFTRIMKLLNLLPYGLYFPMLNRMTKWKERPLASASTTSSGKAGKSGAGQAAAKRW